MSLNKWMYWLIFTISLLLLFSSWALYYPLGYHTNTYLYGAFLLYNLFGLPKDYCRYLTEVQHKAKNTCLGCSSLFLLAFIFTGGILWIPFETLCDFDDETVFVNAHYRVVTTSQIIRSGNQSYIAILERNSLSESCVFKSLHPRRWDDPAVIETPKGAALRVRKEVGGCCDTLYWHRLLAKSPL